MTRYADINELARSCSQDTKDLSPELFKGIKPAKGSKSPTPSKWGNKRVTVDGIDFDSIKEANRYFHLVILQRKGEIKELARQVWFDLPSGVRMRIDATYKEPNPEGDDLPWLQIAEDTKGSKKSTPQAWKDKAKQFKDSHPAWILRIYE